MLKKKERRIVYVDCVIIEEVNREGLLWFFENNCKISCLCTLGLYLEVHIVAAVIFDLLYIFGRFLISQSIKMEFLTDHTVIMPLLVVAFHFLTAAGVWFYHRLRHRFRPPAFEEGNSHSICPTLLRGMDQFNISPPNFFFTALLSSVTAPAIIYLFCVERRCFLSWLHPSCSVTFVIESRTHLSVSTFSLSWSDTWSV